MTASVLIRYFAAAADAAGVDEERLEIPAGSTIEDLRSNLGSIHGVELERVLGLCSFLLNGQNADPGAALAPGEDGGIQVDVLPPFAGG